MKYPSVTHKSSGRRAFPSVRRTMLVAPSAPIRKSDCSDESRVDSVQPCAAGSTVVTRLFTMVTPACSAPAIRYLPNSCRDSTARGCSVGTVTERWSLKYMVMRSMYFRGSSESKIAKLESAFVVTPPPQGFSHGACESMRVTACPRLASSVEAQVPAGPAPIMAIRMCSQTSIVEGRLS